MSAVLKRELKGDTEIVSEQLIGLIRCTSDRVFNATIWDVLVSPEYQVNSGPNILLYVHSAFQKHFWQQWQLKRVSLRE